MAAQDRPLQPALSKVPLFHTSRSSSKSNPIPSSSPAFSTPIHPHPPTRLHTDTGHPILPVLLSPAILRPLAFRTFTKKHDLNLTSSALQAFAGFIGKHCGSGWREEGHAERVLDEIAKQWKMLGGEVLVPGESLELRNILQRMEMSMDAGRPRNQSGIAKLDGIEVRAQEASLHNDRPTVLNRNDNLGMSALGVADNADLVDSQDPRPWLKVVDAFGQPRLSYNMNQKHFEAALNPPSLFPGPAEKTSMFRQRYHLVHQRLLRNESFQTSAVTSVRRGPNHTASFGLTTAQQAYKLTPIANLLGRGGSNHMLLGLLSKSPSGLLTINDLTGSIPLDIQHARPSPEEGVWFAPGMIVVVDGQYEDGESTAGSGLDGNTGVGGTIGGVFVVFGMTGPPCERREATLGVSNSKTDSSHALAADFGWTDFLGVGSERAVGRSMRAHEAHALSKYRSESSSDGRGRIVMLGEVNLDNVQTLQALKKILGIYAGDASDQTPMAFILMGNFVRHAVMAGGGSGGGIEYKEYFDSLASTLSEYPTILQNTTFVFVPGDSDPWASAFSAGAATVIPRSGVPDLFTSRIRKAFATANAEGDDSNCTKMDGEGIWSTNPTRLTLFGPAHEIVVFRDDISGRLRRNALCFKKSDKIPFIDDVQIGGTASTVDSRSTPREQAAGRMETGSVVRASTSPILAGKEEIPRISPETKIARKLVRTILDQGHLSPFPISQRPVLWDFGHSLQLHPLPTALVVMDTQAPAFAVGLDGCHVMNPGSLIVSGKKGVTQWMEYNIQFRKGKPRNIRF